MLPPNRPSSTLKLLAYFAFVTFSLLILYEPRLGGFHGWNWDRASSSALADNDIPKKIWYKLGPKGLSIECKQWMDTCLSKSPSYKYEIFTDASADEYVKREFAYRQDIIDIFLGLTVPILKADLLRYLLLFNEGGIYNDLDVSCETPIETWIPSQFKKEANLVVGWEFDAGWEDNIIREFASWTILAKAGSPHMLMTINDTIDYLREKTVQHNVGYEGLTLEMTGDVVDATGPRRMTRGIFKSLEVMLNRAIDIREEVGNLLEPAIIGDVLILPGYAFANSSNTYPEGQGGQPLVTHHYAGTWKNSKGGEIA